jgi:hypothetical protein
MKLRWTLPLAACLLTACAVHKPMYQWGGYEDMLYRGYKEPEKMLALRNAMVAHTQALEQSGQKVPPGLYSEIATIYMQAGERDNALRYYTLEKDAWPESRGLMQALIQNLDRKEATK